MKLIQGEVQSQLLSKSHGGEHDLLHVSVRALLLFPFLLFFTFCCCGCLSPFSRVYSALLLDFSVTGSGSEGNKSIDNFSVIGDLFIYLNKLI